MSTHTEPKQFAKYETNIDHGLPGASPATGFASEKVPKTSLVTPDSDSDDHSGLTRHPSGAAPTMIKTNSRVFQVTPDDNSSDLVEIRERSLTLVQTTSLLLVEYVVLAILAFPWSYSILGMAGGVITTLIVAATTLYTSLILWKYCMVHPQIRDIADVAYTLCGGSRIAWTAAFIGLALNNMFIMGLHLNAGTTAINTLGYTICSALWGVILLVIMYIGSLVRGFSHAEAAAVVSAGTMLLCFFFVVIGAGVIDHPNGYISDSVKPVVWTVWAPKGTTFVQGVSALLNIVYTFTGQALIPSFVGDMKNPEEFPKALYISMSVEVLLFTICGAVVYNYAGGFATTPGYGSLTGWWLKCSAALTLPTIIIVGILYSLVTSRAVFFQIFNEKSIHRRTHTVKGWGVWVAIVSVGWIIAFIIGESIPFFGDLLSVISSLFGSWFGYIFWGSAYFAMNWGKPFRGRHAIESVVCAILIFTGIFILGVGTYTSVQSIINSYAAGVVKTPFACGNSGF